MGRRYSNSILCGFFLNSICLVDVLLWSFLLSVQLSSYHSYADSSDSLFNIFTASSFTYPQTRIKPYEWRYLRVDIPPWFSSMSVELESDVDLDASHISDFSKSSSPLICLRDGSLPLPDFTNSLNNLVLETLSNGTIGEARGIQSGEHCYPLQKRLVLRLTNEQMIPGVWYFGLFNGIGALRTQSKMINRGKAYTFSANVSVQGCTSTNMGGPYCNQTIEPLSCSSPNLYTQSAKLVISCQNSPEASCLLENEPHVYSVEVIGLAEQLNIVAANVSFNATSDGDSIGLMCYARHGAMPSPVAHDYAGDVNKSPLRIQSPKIGRWYISIVVANAVTTYGTGRSPIRSGKICYSLQWQVVECPRGKTGSNCSWERYTLQILRASILVILLSILYLYYLAKEWGTGAVALIARVMRKQGTSDYIYLNHIVQILWASIVVISARMIGLIVLTKLRNGCLQTILRKNPSAPFESYYMPPSDKISSVKSANFPLEPILSNNSYYIGNSMRYAWTYMTFEIPRGAAGGNLHIRLTGGRNKSNYEIYARSGGLPSDKMWDYFYVSKTNNSGGVKFFMVSNSSKEIVDFSIMFVREGTWTLGIKHLKSTITQVAKDETAMSISLERCPNKCSSHGSCSNYVDDSGLTIYSYCSCDRRHGGFDCSVELVSHRGTSSIWPSDGHMWQSIALVASNAAAILPAYWSLRQKAFAEWVIYTSSGISSALYHACDVGTWCALKFKVLQFMDFWLSFMAVVSTFVYLAAIDEGSKRTIQAAVSILTALMAVSDATRSSNIAMVMSIGAAGLLVGWLIELSTKCRCSRFQCLSLGCCINGLNRRQTLVDSARGFMKRFLKRFRWGFLVAGVLALTMAAISWKLESSETYWIWHSMWHLSIYTSSFLFLCSKATKTANENDQREQNENYELARQNSLPRGA